MRQKPELQDSRPLGQRGAQSWGLSGKRGPAPPLTLPPTFYSTFSAYLGGPGLGRGPLRAGHQRKGAQGAGETGGAERAGGAIGAVGGRGAKSSWGQRRGEER